MSRLKLLKESSKHLEASQETYVSHLFWATYAGAKMIVVGVSSIIHGIIPAFFQGTAAKTIINFYHERLVDHPNREYTDYISQKIMDKGC
jgi:hypothetical protein